jgi:hypothetical protein
LGEGTSVHPPELPLPLLGGATHCPLALQTAGETQSLTPVHAVTHSPDVPQNQDGSTIAGYTTGLPRHVTLTRQFAAPLALTGRRQRVTGFLSYAQPSMPSAAGIHAPAASTMLGGAMRSRGVPRASRNSSTLLTSLSLATQETSTS